MNSLQNSNIKGKKILVRCDLDVFDELGELKDTFRLSSCLKTLNFILEQGGFAFICGHIGKTQLPNEIFSTKKFLPFFQQNLINSNFEIIENLRFNEGEEKNSEIFSRELADKKDIFVNESFATSHRNHASITGVVKILPSYFGLHFEDELENLNYVLESNHKPLVVVIGGAKIESKKPTIDRFLNVADYILVGGKLLFEESLKNNPKIILASPNSNGLDINEESIDKFREHIFNAKTIFWSGPMGNIENPDSIKGSLEIAEFISKSGSYSVVGGGDTVAFLEKYNLTHRFSFVSVGGSALLEYLSCGTLVGIEAMKNYGQKNS